jgi:hypothetical protein
MDYLPIPFTAEHYPFKELKGTSETQPFCFFIPIDAFETNASSFAQIKKNRNSQYYVTLLSVFSHLVNGNKKLCERTKEEDEENDDDDVNMEDTPEEVAIPCRSKLVKISTRVILEAVQSKNGNLLGWRFFIFNMDSAKFNYGLGVQNLIADNIERKAKKKKFGNDPDKPFHSVIDTAYWMYIVCDSYLMKATDSDTATKVLDPETPLKTYSNPCHPLKVFHLNNSLKIAKLHYPDVSPDQVNYRNYVGDENVYTFPRRGNTWELQSDMLNLDILQGCEFPTIGMRTYDQKCQEYQERVSRVLHLQYKPLSKELCFKEPSDIGLLALKNASLLNKCENDIERKSLRNGTLMDDFIKIFRRENKMSGNLKTMLKWYDDLKKTSYEKNEKVTLQNICQPLDADLSPFANMVALKFYEYEKVLQTSTVHKELFIILVARLDAYRRSFKLHTNPLLAGQGSTSKSYILDCVDKLSIPGTINVVTHETAKANSVDDNQNDLITFYHEVPLHMLGVEGGKQTQGDPTLKERLTSCTYKTKLFVVDEDTGKRYNRTAVSEMIGIIAGATNDPVSKIPEALRSRFLIIMCPSVFRKDHNVIDYFASERIANERVEKVKFKHQTEQFLVCVIEKMIWCGILNDVNMSVAKFTFSKAITELHREGVDASAPRPFEFLLNTSRTLTIMYAVHMVFNCKTSNIVNKAQEFDFRLLLETQKYLFCTEEISIFTLSLLGFQYINPLDKIVVKTMASMSKYNPDNATTITEKLAARQLAREYEEQTRDVHLNDMIDEIMHIPPELSNPQQPGDAFVRGNMVGANTFSKTIYKITPDGKIDYNYVSFEVPDGKKSTMPISYEIIKHLSNGYKDSVQNIQLVLENLRTRTFLTHKRTGENEIDDTSPKEKMRVLEISPGTTSVYVLASYIDLISNQSDSVLAECITKTFHQYSRPRKIILGETYIMDPLTLPHLLHTMKIVSVQGKLLQRSNPNFIDKFDVETIENHDDNYICELVDMDIEEFEFSKHLLKSGFSNQNESEWKEACISLPKNIEKLYSSIYKNDPKMQLLNGNYPKLQKERFTSAIRIRRQLSGKSQVSAENLERFSMSKRVKVNVPKI